jgi:acyl-CoA thioester hydrolase
MTAPSSGWLEGREHQLPVRIYYEDTDFTGVVYHGQYVRFFERGRSDFLRLVGVAHSSLLNQQDPAAFTVVTLNLAFKRPARIDDALLVRTRIVGLKGPRLYFSQTITRGDEVICEAQVEAACIDLSGRPRKPSKNLIATMLPLVG